MALDPAVAAGVAVGCVVFLIVTIFLFIKVRTRGFDSSFASARRRNHGHSFAHTQLLARANNVCVLLVDTLSDRCEWRSRSPLEPNCCHAMSSLCSQYVYVAISYLGSWV